MRGKSVRPVYRGPIIPVYCTLLPYDDTSGVSAAGPFTDVVVSVHILLYQYTGDGGPKQAGLAVDRVAEARGNTAGSGDRFSRRLP